MNKTTQTGNRIVLVGLVLLMLGSMLFTIVKAYLAGGPDAPTPAILLLAIAVLGGGMVFALFYLKALLKKYPVQKPTQEEPNQEAPQN